jgi:YebC/PmpR family DNA-binding regulatory protein
MSGHSKWSTIKRQKGAADAKRGQVFTKIANAITIAVREGGGGDPASNFKLRLAIDRAKAVNMPKDNIARAIDRGLGKTAGGADLVSVAYEAYSPGKAALVVEAATDNKNRTTSEIKSLIEKNGGNFVSPGTISWMFTDMGVITVFKEGKDIDYFLDLAIETGGQDVVESGDFVEIYTKPNNFESVKANILEKGVRIESSEILKNPTTMVEITDEGTAKKVLNLMEKLEEHDDVQKVYSNFDISDEVLKVIN